MIYDLSVRLTSRLGKRGYLPDSEEEIVAYGLFSLLSKLMYAVICLILGLIFSVPLESMIFYAVFLFVKKYGGGFHASTEGRCMILSTIEILLSICFVFFALRESVILRSGALASAVSYIIICILSPAAAKEKPLDKAEKIRYRERSIIRVTLTFAAMTAVLIFGYPRICAPLCA
ncbi:MAG: accessory gene regulator B family protein, partial [Acutalibacteraceae bacterium]|nr:accessory gene regulator B family protein [Acutalibacteraceae bacterium]